MNWISNYVRPKINSLFSRREVPENLWTKCPECGAMLFHRELSDNLFVCTSCDHHMAISPRARFSALFDGGIFTEVKTIHVARGILEAIEGEAKGLLVDTLHWARSGGTAEDLAAIPRAWFSYCQPCDAPAEGPDLASFDAIIDDAINRRMPLGLGGLPLADMVDALPAHLPMAIEERSAALRDAFPDLNERARECARTSRAWLDSRGLDARA
jgi:hypothetical protein